MSEVSGATRVCFVVADPVKQLRTPQALNRIWAEDGFDAIAVPAQVAAGSLADFVDGLRANGSALGAVITVPHKQAAVELCDELGPNALIVGAVNVIRRTPDGRIIGETFDGLGFVAGLKEAGIEPAGLNVVVLGAGGAASAVAVALISAGAARLDVHNRTQARADQLGERLRAAFPGRDISTGLERVAEASLVVNATSTGMSSGDVSPLEPSLLPDGAIAADVVMSAEPTPFLAAAAARGNRTQEGTRMLAGQLRLLAAFLAE